MENGLKYFKVRTKIGHMGAGFYGDMNVYVASFSMMDAVKKVKHLPKVKHSSSLPLTSISEVDEKEFVVLGLMKNAYTQTRFLNDDTVIDVRPLESIQKEVISVFRLNEPTTLEAKKLVWFAKKLGEETSQNEKKNLKYSYLSWAEKTIEEFYEQNENI